MKLSCHCGNIEIEVDPPSQLTVCNCSICRRYQALWGYYPPEDVDITMVEKNSAAYIWGDRMLKFVHCTTCGCVTHYETLEGQPNPIFGVNFRMAEEREVEGIPLRHFDGAKLL